MEEEENDWRVKELERIGTRSVQRLEICVPFLNKLFKFLKTTILRLFS